MLYTSGICKFSFLVAFLQLLTKTFTKSLKTLLYIFIILCGCMWVYVCHNMHMEVRGQIVGVGSLLPTMWLPEINLRSSGSTTGAFAC